MKVILLEDVKGVGKKGQMIDAADGHARNFLIPKKLAVEATAGHMHELEDKKKAVLRRQTSELESAQALAKTLSAATLKVPVKCGEKGKLFGSVTNKELAAVLSKQTGLEIDKKKVILEEPIKTIGEKQITVKLHSQVSARITVEIVRAED
ncbi:MAG: 50S ribosomal protein L9 [Clostridiales bacterium]|jgi:large subunit ribosomal protein L9|nr:50S ribosomal protein L9 [Clostridiales bacterium]